MAASLETIEKYEKKLAEGIKKRNYRKFIEDESDDDEELEKKIKKYEHKISKAKAAFKGDTSTADVSAVNVDKSGMSLLLFYAYVEPGWNSKQHTATIKWAEDVLSRNEVTGRLRVSREGFNGTLTGTYDGIRAWTTALRGYYNGYFKDMKDHDDFKYTDNLPLGQAFSKLKVFPVVELVNYGLGVDDPPPISKHGGVHLAPSDYNAKLKEPNTVVIDIRNTYEADIGRFQPVEGGAEYIDPKMRVSTEFPQWAKDNVEKLKDKQVLMYCTGGIRCERASALFRSLGHDQVFQLKGGIHKYLEDFPEGSDSQWVGQNYTFDKRFAHGAAKRDDDEDNEHDEEVEEEAAEDEGEQKNTIVIGRCCGCNVPWDKYRGKKRCHSCGVPLLICPACVENDKAKTAECTLCQEDVRLGRKRFDKAQHKRDVQKSLSEVPLWRQKAGETASATAGAKGAGRSQKPTADQKCCGVCKEVFKSRNALFKHINESGHHNRHSKKK